MLAALLASVCLLKVVHAELPQEPISEDDTPLFCVDFDADIVLAAQQSLYRQIVNTLIGFTDVPKDQLTYFSAVNNSNNCVILFWLGIITNVQANCNGYFVTVQVIPSLTSTVYGAAAFAMTTDYSEHYQVNNDGTFQYQGSVYTQALAGQMPNIIGF